MEQIFWYLRLTGEFLRKLVSRNIFILFSLHHFLLSLKLYLLLFALYFSIPELLQVHLSSIPFKNSSEVALLILFINMMRLHRWFRLRLRLPYLFNIEHGLWNILFGSCKRFFIAITLWKNLTKRFSLLIASWRGNIEQFHWFFHLILLLWKA